MPDVQPSAGNDYQVGSETTFSRELWDAVMASIGARLRAREALEATFAGLIAQGTQASLDLIQVNVGPRIAQLVEQIDYLDAQLEGILIGGTAPNALHLAGHEPSYFLALANATGALPVGQVSGVTELVAAAIVGKAPLASPAFSGAPTAPTPALGTNTDRLATMAALQELSADLVRGLVADPLAASGVVPTLDLPFTSPDAIDPAWFSRASTGYRRRASGLLESVGAGLLRIDHDEAGRALGALVEETRSNLWTWSGDLGQAVWLKGPGGFHVAAASSLPDPFGSTVSWQFTANGVSGLFMRRSGFAFASGARYAHSLWVYVPSQAGVTSWRLSCDLDDAQVVVSAERTTFDRWVRVTLVLAPTAARSQLDLNMMANGGAASPAGFTFRVCAPQLEAGAFATSDVITAAGASTRSGDGLAVPVTDDWYNPAEGTVFVDATVPALGGPGNPGLFAFDNGGLNDFLHGYIADGAGDTIHIDLFRAGSGVAGPVCAALPPGSPLRLAFSFAPGAQLMSVNGGPAWATAVAALPAPPSTMRLGRTVLGGDPLNGTIRRFAYVPRALDAGTLRRMTA